MNDPLNSYDELVTFLGNVLGESYEVALQDCRTGYIRAIANGHISGRSVGAPLTDLAVRLIYNDVWKTTDYICNYEGHAKDNKILRSSTFFIKKNHSLLGMLCINVNTADYEKICELAYKLGGLNLLKPKQMVSGIDMNIEQENFYENIDETAKTILYDIYGSTPPSNFSQEERLQIIERLNNKGVFLIKGSVVHISMLLGCSEASLYRYLSKIKRNLSDS